MNRRHVLNLYKRSMLIIFLSIPIFIFLDKYLKGLNEFFIIATYVLLGFTFIGIFETIRKKYIQKVREKINVNSPDNKEQDK